KAGWSSCHGLRRRFHKPARVRSDHATGRVVGPTVTGFPGTVGFHRLLDVGSVPGRALSLGAVPVAVLLAGTFWRCHPQLVRGEAGLVAGVAAVFAGALDSLGAGRIPAHLLLLSGRLLQGILGRPAFLH